MFGLSGFMKSGRDNSEEGSALELSPPERLTADYFWMFVVP